MGSFDHVNRITSHYPYLHQYFSENIDRFIMLTRTIIWGYEMAGWQINYRYLPHRIHSLEFHLHIHTFTSTFSQALDTNSVCFVLSHFGSKRLLMCVCVLYWVHESPLDQQHMLNLVIFFHMNRHTYNLHA